MLLPKFEYHAPAGLDEALEILGRYGSQARVLAGGTDLLVNMKRKVMAPAHVVALDRLPGLADISSTRAEISIGARVTAASAAESRAIRKRLAVLAEGAGRLGSPLIRNLATIGGNLATARPAADTAPALMALGARVVLVSSGSEREIRLDDFFIGPGQTVIRPEEILTRVKVPAPEPGSGGGYVKLGLRRTLEISIVNVAAVITLGPGGRKIRAARVVLGAVAPTPIRSPRAEEALIGAEAGQKAFRRAGRAAALDARPITDHRGSAEYRKMVVEVLTRRALGRALKEARR